MNEFEGYLNEGNSWPGPRAVKDNSSVKVVAGPRNHLSRSPPSGLCQSVMILEGLRKKRLAFGSEESMCMDTFRGMEAPR